MSGDPEVMLNDIGPENWRDVAKVAPRPDQAEFVAPTTYYLCLSHFDGEWNCLAIETRGKVIGHVMWGVEDQTAWIGGLVIDAAHQNRGFGRATVEALSARMAARPEIAELALSYEPENLVARHLYAGLGFVETGETEGDELVARKLIR